MERCISCGASLSPDIPWCGQCLAPKASLVGATSQYRRPLRPSDLIADPTGGRDRLVVVPDLDPPRRSIWRATETGFGLLGRLLMTAALFLIGLALWMLLTAVVNDGGTPLQALRMMIAGFYTIAAGLLLASIWRPHRSVNPAAFDRTPKIVRIDGPLVEEPSPGPTRPDLV